MPSYVPSYSGAEREILLNPTINFRGIIGPRLEFATNTSVDGTMRCFHNLPNQDSYNSHDVVRGRQTTRSTSTISPRKSSSTTRLRQQSSDDALKPPFVVRKINDCMFSRKPSLFQDYDATTAYCCASPHRHSYCAACRMRHRSPSPGIKRSWSSQPNLSRERSTQKLDQPQESVGYTTKDRISSDYRTSKDTTIRTNGVARSENRSPPPPARTDAADDPESAKSPTAFLSPRLKRWSDARLSSTAAEDRPATSPRSHRRSPIFSRPTFHDRFADVPVDVIVEPRCDDRAGLATIDDHSRHDQCDNFHVNKFGSGICNLTASCQYCRNCNCTCNRIYSHNCRCPYCPTYWKFQLGPTPSRWQMFNRGLASLYDDMYRYPGYF